METYVAEQGASLFLQPSRARFPLQAKAIQRIFQRKKLPASEEEKRDSREGLESGLENAAGFVLGDLLALALASEGSPSTSFLPQCLRSFQLGIYGFFLDSPFARKVLKAPKEAEVQKAAFPDTIDALQQTKRKALSWLPLMMCGVFAGLKIMEGRPDEVLGSVEEKMGSLLVANYCLWPIMKQVISTHVPEQHRKLAQRVITVLWSAGLTTLGHQSMPSLDCLDGVTSVMGEQVQQALQTVVDSPFLQNGTVHQLGVAAGAAASPFAHSAGNAVTQTASHALRDLVAAMDRLPSSFLERAFSKSLDMLNPLTAAQRSPSQLLSTALSGALLDPKRRMASVMLGERMATRDLGPLERMGTLGIGGLERTGGLERMGTLAMAHVAE